MEELSVVLTPQDDGGLRYSIIDETGALLLSGGPFPGQDDATEALKAAIELIGDPDRFDIQEEGGGFRVILRAPEGDAIAIGSLYEDPTEARDFIETFVDAAQEQERFEVTLTRISERSVALPLTRTRARTEVEIVYVFTRVSVTRAPGVERFDFADIGSFLFHINDMDGAPFLFSPSFESAAKREQRLRSVLKSADDGRRYEERGGTEEGGYYVILKARNGWEIARSRVFESAQALRLRITWLMEEAEAWLVGLGRGRRRGEGSDQYDLTLRGEHREEGFETLHVEGDRPYVFIFKDADGHSILFSQGYQDRRSRDNGLRSVIRNAGIEARYDVREEDGGWVIFLKAGNHQQLARSIVFASAAEAWAIVAWLRIRIITYAQAFGVVLRTRAEVSREHFTLTVDREEGTDASPGGGGALGLAALAAAAALGGAGVAAAAPGEPGEEPEEDEGEDEDEDAPEGSPPPSEASPPTLLEEPDLGEDDDAGEDSISELMQAALWEQTLETRRSAASPPTPAAPLAPEPEEPEHPEDPWAEARTEIALPRHPDPDPSPSRSEPEASEPVEATRPLPPPPLPPASPPPVTATSALSPAPSSEGAPPRSPHAGPTPSPPGRSSLLWVIPLVLILLLLLFFALRQPQAPVAQAPVAQAPVAQAPVAQAPVAQAPVAQAPVAVSPQSAAPDASEAADAHANHGGLAKAPAAPEQPEAPPSEVAAFPAAAAGPGALPPSPPPPATGPNAAAAPGASTAAAPPGSATAVADRTGAAPSPASQSADPGAHGLHSGHAPPSAGKVPTLDRAALDAAPLAPGSTEAALLAFLKGDSGGTQTFTMTGLRYPQDSHDVGDSGKEQIYYIAQILNAYPGAHMEIHGHRDASESALYSGPDPRDNLPLSDLRADCVLLRLTWLGVPRSSLSGHGHGADKPVATGSGADAAQANRRVELVVSRP